MKRIHSIDFMRGLVMIIMALDHTRDLMHVSALIQDPLNLTTTTPWLFGTRWITHLCAPTFVFLSGTSAWLSYQQQGSLPDSRRFLLTRGLWLIVLDYTIVNFAIWFDPLFRILLSQVIAAIGFGFVILSFLMRFSPRTIGIIALIIIFGHNLLENINFPSGSVLHVVWGILFKLSFFQVSPQFAFFINYPLIPWLGIILAGYSFGQYFLLPDGPRRITLLQFGIGALLLFILLRIYNLYGDSQHWSFQKNGLYTFMSFVNVNKYPPSLLFVSITLGITFLLLFFADGRDNQFIKIVSVYGKVPLFYYVLHWYILHNLMLIIMFLQGFKWSELNFAPFGFGRPQQVGGVGLIGIYLIWGCVVAALYPLCQWYGRYKAAHRDKKWLRYI